MMIVVIGESEVWGCESWVDLVVIRGAIMTVMKVKY